MLKKMRSIYLVVIMQIVATVVNAQVTTASMSGIVTTQNEPVIGATIQAIHEPSGTRYGAVTNIDGRFNLQGMRVGGPYKVEISYIGYQKAVYTGIFLRLGEIYVLNVDLKESAELLNEVIITADQSIAKSGVLTNVTERQITTLPTITRSITDFTKLSPYAGSSNSFAGRDGRYNNVTIDGAAFNNSFGLTTNLPGGDAQPIALDAIEEISVNVSPFDVKYSNFTGASVNAVTKSGTNNFSGSVYTFQKPNGFNGNTIDGQEISGWDSKSTRSYGFTFGGPILKNKLFFFLSGEIEKSVMPGILWKPSADENASGDSKTYTSRTWVGDLNRVQSFVQNQYGYNPGKYENFDKFTSNNYKILARVDWNINNDHKFTARFNYVDSKNDQMLSATSAVLTRTSPGRYSNSSIAFSNSNFAGHNVVSSFAAELNSRFSNNIQNKLIATYTHIQDARSYNGSPFPYIDIQKSVEDPTQYMTLGTEVFTPFNNVVSNVFNITDNVNISLGDHYLTAGLSFDRQFFSNQFLSGPLGYYRYASVDDFVNQKQPLFYGLTYGYNGVEAPGAELAFGLGGVYAQDEWSITPNFRLSYGIRLDLPMYFNSMIGNDAILKEEFANGERVDVAKWPKTRVLFSPRLGFNWDIKGDRSIILSGGTGVFTGLLPFVWFTNQPTNAGMIQNKIEIGNSQYSSAPLPEDFKFYKDYKEVLAKYPDLFPSQPASKLPGSIAFVDPKFKMPQVWRSNINLDIKLPYDFQFSVGAMYTRDVYSVLQKNINEAAPTGTYSEQPGRVYWKTPRVNSNTASVIKLTNGDKKGYQYAFNAVLSKRFSYNVSGMVGYTYSVVKDLTANPGSVAASAWQNSVAVNSLNEEILSNSSFSTPHRIIGSISYELSLSKHSKTTFSLFYNGFHQGRYSYVYSNDMNGDGNRSDLIYVPNTLDEMTPMFVDMVDKNGNVTYSGKDQATDFWNYVNGKDSYLKGRKGKFVERNGSLLPWLNRFDFKIAQDFYAVLGHRKYGIQVSFDILNIGNMLNDAWGSYKTCGFTEYNNLLILKTTSKIGEPLRYQVNATSHDNWLNKSEWYNTADVSNAWAMQIGVKLTF